ncbi:MAG: ABC transporter permease [Chloroflexi bacterium]|nr:ABC transporter permease [Chloroflexota bacterium]
MTVFRRTADWLPPVILFVVVLAVWEGASIGFGIQSFLLPRPSLILERVAELWPDTLARGVAFTATEALGGLVIGVLAGTLAGLATARWATARETLLPIAIGASTVPIIAFAPITINWFGPESMLPRMIVVAAMVFFPIMVNTVRGLTQVEPAALELMASYAASDSQTLTRLRIPNALPFWFTALRIATSLSVIGAVVGEFFGGPLYSLGIFITNRTGVSNYPDAWAAIVLACALGIAFYCAALVAERLVVPWQAAREASR